MQEKLFPSELKVMEIIWSKGETTAKEIAAAMAQNAGWSKTTTYKENKKCVEKGAIIRSEPGFVCTAAVSRAEVQSAETQELIDRLFCGEPDLLVSALVSSGKISAEQLSALREAAEKAEKAK